MICPSLTRIVLHAAIDRVHEGVTAAGGRDDGTGERLEEGRTGSTRGN